MKLRTESNVTLLTVILVVSVILLIVDVTSSDGGSFITIWPAIMLPVIATRKHEKDKQKQEIAKRKRQPVDRYTLMHRLVDDLDASERAYLRHRLETVRGDLLADEY